MWVAFIVACAFLAAHYVLGKSWERLIADYNVFRARIWMLVLLMNLFTTIWAFSQKQRKRRAGIENSTICADRMRSAVRRRPHSESTDVQRSRGYSPLLDRSWNGNVVEPRDVFAHQFGAHFGGEIA